MREVQTFREGNVVLINGEAWIIQRMDFNTSGTGRRSNPVVKLKIRNLLKGNTQEQVFKPDDRLDLIVLERKQCQFSYQMENSFVFMDEEFNQYEIDAEMIEEMVKYIEDGMTDVCEVTFYDDKPISVELPTTIEREVAYTEPAARGDTSGKVTKVARLHTGHELQVAAFIEIGDKIIIDTRTGEFKGRA